VNGSLATGSPARASVVMSPHRLPTDGEGGRRPRSVSTTPGSDRIIAHAGRGTAPPHDMARPYGLGAPAAQTGSSNTAVRRKEVALGKLLEASDSRSISDAVRESHDAKRSEQLRREMRMVERAMEAAPSVEGRLSAVKDRERVVRQMRVQSVLTQPADYGSILGRLHSGVEHNPLVVPDPSLLEEEEAQPLAQPRLRLRITGADSAAATIAVRTAQAQLAAPHSVPPPPRLRLGSLAMSELLRIKRVFDSAEAVPKTGTAAAAAVVVVAVAVAIVGSSSVLVVEVEMVVIAHTMCV